MYQAWLTVTCTMTVMMLMMGMMCIVLQGFQPLPLVDMGNIPASQVPEDVSDSDIGVSILLSVNISDV